MPDESSTTSVTPCSTAADIIMAAPRSLNDPVGLANSSLPYSRSTPAAPPTDGIATMGVFPSPSVRASDGLCSGTGIGDPDPPASR